MSQTIENLIAKNKDSLIEAAVKAKSHSYSPYSEFPVGAAVLSENGKIYSGTNIENASYPVGWCAESTAISCMIMDGEKRIIAAAVSSNMQKDFISPCGKCRQVFVEFKAQNAEGVLFLMNNRNEVKEISFEKMLPFSFSASALEKN